MIKKILLFAFIIAMLQNAFAGQYQCYRCVRGSRQGFQGVDPSREITTCDIKRLFSLQNEHYHCLAQKAGE